MKFRKGVEVFLEVQEGSFGPPESSGMVGRPFGKS